MKVNSEFQGADESPWRIFPLVFGSSGKSPEIYGQIFCIVQSPVRWLQSATSSRKVNGVQRRGRKSASFENNECFMVVLHWWHFCSARMCIKLRFCSCFSFACVYVCMWCCLQLTVSQQQWDEVRCSAMHFSWFLCSCSLLCVCLCVIICCCFFIHRSHSLGLSHLISLHIQYWIVVVVGFYQPEETRMERWK